MRDGSESPFAYVRAPEAEALKQLSPNASKLWIAIRFGRSEADPFEVGIRDFEDWNIGRTTASKALDEIIGAGLLKVVREASFGAKKLRRRFEFAFKRGDEIQTAHAVTPAGYRPPTRSRGAATDREGGHGAAIQTARAVTSKNAPRPSASEPKGRGAFEKTPPPAPPAPPRAVADAADPIGDEIERAAERVAPNRERLRRIGDAAKALSIGSREFIWAAGGPEPADFIARRFAAGLSVDQLRTALGEAQRGLGRVARGDPQFPPTAEARSVIASTGSEEIRLIGTPAVPGQSLWVVRKEFEDLPVPRRIAR